MGDHVHEAQRSVMRLPVPEGTTDRDDADPLAAHQIPPDVRRERAQLALADGVLAQAPMTSMRSHALTCEAVAVVGVLIVLERRRRIGTRPGARLRQRGAGRRSGLERRVETAVTASTEPRAPSAPQRGTRAPPPATAHDRRGRARPTGGTLQPQGSLGVSSNGVDGVTDRLVPCSATSSPTGSTTPPSPSIDAPRLLEVRLQRAAIVVGAGTVPGTIDARHAPSATAASSAARSARCHTTARMPMVRCNSPTSTVSAACGWPGAGGTGSRQLAA